MRTEAIKQRLLARRRQLVLRYHDEIERADEHLGEREPELVDQATEEWEASVLARLGETDARALHDVVAAIKRFDDGTYGRCRTCSQPIAVARLEALPTADLCMPCADETRTTRPFKIVREPQIRRGI